MPRNFLLASLNAGANITTHRQNGRTSESWPVQILPITNYHNDDEADKLLELLQASLCFTIQPGSKGIVYSVSNFFQSVYCHLVQDIRI